MLDIKSEIGFIDSDRKEVSEFVGPQFRYKGRKRVFTLNVLILEDVQNIIITTLFTIRNIILCL